MNRYSDSARVLNCKLVKKQLWMEDYLRKVWCTADNQRNKCEFNPPPSASQSVTIKVIKLTLTQNIRGPVSGDEARVVPITHPLLQDAFAEILPEAAARRHQAVVAAVCLRKSADDSSGNQSTVRQHGQHHLHTSSE